MTSVFETLSHAARQWPERPAIVEAAGTLDYRSLWREIEALRVQLDRRGVRHGQGVGVLARNGRAFVIAALAASGCGAVVMPIYHLLKPGEIAEMLARAPLSAVIEEGNHPHVIEGSLDQLELRDRTPLRYTRLTGRESSVLVPWLRDAAFVRFTSGTTGRAKGVILTHEGVLERIHAANLGLGLGPSDTVVWVLPMAYHFFVSILLYLEVGATIVVTQDHLADSILDAAAQHDATFLYAAPMHIRMLAADASGRPLPQKLQRVMSVSSRLPPQTAREFAARYRVPVAQGYGIIEVGLPIVNMADAANRPEAIGRLLPDFDAAILDETMSPVVNGATGQLALCGPGLFAGYLDPPLRREEVLRDGWFLTGDLVHRNRAGLLTVDGRTKSVINVAGHKVFPEDVASVLDQHPAVLRSRVTARPHHQLGEVVHAEIQLREGIETIGTEELLAFCRRRLSSQMVPVSIEVRGEVEITPSGKVRHG